MQGDTKNVSDLVSAVHCCFRECSYNLFSTLVVRGFYRRKSREFERLLKLVVVKQQKQRRSVSDCLVSRTRHAVVQQAAYNLLCTAGQRSILTATTAPEKPGRTPGARHSAKDRLKSKDSRYSVSQCRAKSTCTGACDVSTVRSTWHTKDIVSIHHAAGNISYLALLHTSALMYSGNLFLGHVVGADIGLSRSGG